MKAAGSDSASLQSEVATVFSVQEEQLVGILHAGDQTGTVGVLFVVGGRQYRTGAQRQLVRLGRYLASAGYPAFRFDVRGMGDSAAEPKYFLETTSDITAAIAEFRKLAPQIDQILLWGLCDGASAAIVYASEFTGVDGVLMVNPWISTRIGAARTTMKHYYQKRLISRGFWKRLLKGKINPLESLFSIGELLRHQFNASSTPTSLDSELPDVVFNAVESFNGCISVIVSKKDLTAREFKDEHDRRYGKALKSSPFDQIHCVDADHTFSTVPQHRSLENLTLEWCERLASRCQATQQLGQSSSGR